MKVEATLHGDRKVYSVSAFNRGIGSWLARLPTLWVEGEVTELRRQDGWQSVFFTLKDLEDGSCLPVSMPRTTFDALRLAVADGDKVHVFGRPELYEARGVSSSARCRPSRSGSGPRSARIERLKHALAAEGLFAAERKRPLPLLPRTIGLLRERGGREARLRHGRDRALPAARVLVAETLVQGAKAPRAIVAAPSPSRTRPRWTSSSSPAAAAASRTSSPSATSRWWPWRRAPSPSSRRSARAGHAALRPGRRRPRLDADRRCTPRRAGRAEPPRGARPAPQRAGAGHAPDPGARPPVPRDRPPAADARALAAAR